jgi:lipopolysaccharide biosynthesis glycosyltransferase
MKCIIYQYWDGVETSGNIAGVELMKEYSDRIGVDHLYEHNPKFQTNLGAYSPHYGSFKPIFTESFYDYDYVLFTDTDVVPVNNLEENIFEEFAETNAELGICEEWNAPEIRLKHTIAGINNANDEKWVRMIEENFQVEMPRTNNGLPRIYNSGVVVYSNDGMLKAKNNFIDFSKYISMVKSINLPAFYTCDQPYLHSMLEASKLNWITMDYKWNSSVHYDPSSRQSPRKVNDLRNNSNFVHIQLNGADNFNKDQINEVVNFPLEKWTL